MNGDQDLITQLQDGHLEALGEIYDRYNPLVYRTALAITGDQEAANDLLQDVFLRLYRFAHHVDAQRPLEPWLYRMTANLSYTWVKRSRRWFKPIEDLSEWLAGIGKNVPDESTERNDDWEQVQRAVTQLPVSQRVVVVLYYLNDLSLQDIAVILDVPVGTVKSRLHYGRQALRKKMGLGSFAGGDKLPNLRFERP